MAIVLPPGGEVPPEPDYLPCTKPPECEEDDLIMEARMGWDKWEYKCWTYDTVDAGKIIHVVGYKAKYYRAWQANKPFAHGPPWYEIASGNMIQVIRQP